MILVIPLSFDGGWEAAVGEADSAVVPVDHKIPANQDLQFLNCQQFRIETVVK